MPRKSPRLTLRIATYTAAALLFAAGAAPLVRRPAGHRAGRGPGRGPRALRRRHPPARPVDPRRLRATRYRARRSQLDTLFMRVVESHEIKRVNLIAPNGLITYSTEHRLIGELASDRNSHVRPAFGRSRDSRRRQGRDRRSAREGVRDLSPRAVERHEGRSTRCLRALPGLQASGFRPCPEDGPAGGRLPAPGSDRALRDARPDSAAGDGRGRGAKPPSRRQAATLERSLATAQEARSEAEAARRAMVEQNKRLRELDRLKDEFLSLVSHELRTPLTSIRGYLDLVLDEEAGELNSGATPVPRGRRAQLGRLLRLVGDLLFVAQADAGRLSLEQGKVDLAALAAECVEGAAPAAAAKSIELVLAAKPVPAFVGDRGRLAQVLDNLVSNALKFTPEGARRGQHKAGTATVSRSRSPTMASAFASPTSRACSNASSAPPWPTTRRSPARASGWRS